MTERIVVGVDGSEAANRAVRLGAREAAARGAALELISVWHLPNYPESFTAAMSADKLTKDLVSRADDILGHARDLARIDAPDAPIETRALEGQPATVLIDSSKDADLLVVGSRGLGGFRGLLLGSVGAQCAHHARCPVLIVPHEIANAA
jgi:nucleotide-binding universal stress UspA family protein